MIKKMSQSSFFVLACVLIALRFLHFGTELDAPHDWRQSDTAFYIYDFYKNGVDLLYPAVCWMGASDTVILEFPLPEAIVAIFYQLFTESIPLARFIFLSFFVVAVYYFYKVVDFLFGQELSRISSLVYLALPLSFFYSRAIHIDFFVIMCSHAMFYYFLLAIQQKKLAPLIISLIACTLAFIIKIPYAFYFCLPMLAYLHLQKQWKWFVKYGILFLIPIAAFILWQKHVYAVNSLSPNWDFILHYHPMTQSVGWYFGGLTQRLSLYSWKILLGRGILDVAGLGGVVFLLFGGFQIRNLSNRSILYFWLAGVVLYVLIFFNFNFVHNYYQIPLLAPVALVIGLGMQKLYAKYGINVYLSIGLLACLNFGYAEWAYYKIPKDYVEIAHLINTNTAENDLVIVTYKNMDCRNPNILYRSKRRGWSIEEAALNNSVLEQLTNNESAKYWAYIGNKLPANFLNNIKHTAKLEKISLQSNDQYFYLYQLRK